MKPRIRPDSVKKYTYIFLENTGILHYKDKLSNAV
jgi:hypothetical protein